MRDPSEFPTRLRAQRAESGLTQAELAARAGLQQAHVAHYEAGRRAPSLRNLCRLADALGISLDALVAA